MAVQSLHIHLVPSHFLIILLKDSKDSAHFKCEGKLFQICELSIERLFEPYVVVFLRFISKLFMVLFRTGYKHLKVAQARNFCHFDFFMVLSYYPLKTVQ